MHHCYMEFAGRERREELLREARERRLARAVRSSRWDGGLLHRLLVRPLVGLGRSTPKYEAGCAGFEEGGDATRCLDGCGETAGTA